MFLSVANTFLCNLILERTKHVIEDRLRDEQAGLRKESSCCDLTAKLRIIVEQTLEWNTGLHLFFADLEKAFDFVDREMLWKNVAALRDP